MTRFKLELLDSTKHSWDLNEIAYIGTDTNCTIQLQGESIAGRHTRLEIKGEQLIIKDMRTEAGTLVNGAQIIEAILNDGDLISVGLSDFVVHDLQQEKPIFPLNSRFDFWNDQLQSLSSVAQTKHPVLLLGPSGSGKDIIAQALHQSSAQSKANFLSVNCSALTETLVESELSSVIPKAVLPAPFRIAKVRLKAQDRAPSFLMKSATYPTGFRLNSYERLKIMKSVRWEVTAPLKPMSGSLQPHIRTCIRKSERALLGQTCFTA